MSTVDGEGSSRGARRRPRLIVVCVALAALFGSGVWRMTIGASDGDDAAAASARAERDRSMLRSAGLPAGVPELSTQSGPRTRYDRLAAVDWSAVRYPMDCARGTEVVDSEFADVDKDRAAEAVVLVRCKDGDEHRPTGLFVYDGLEAQTTGAQTRGAQTRGAQTKGAQTGATRPDPGQPRLRATLLKPSDRVAATHIKIGPAMIKASGFGYSSVRVPPCCPDETIEACWRWNGSRFVRVG